MYKLNISLLCYCFAVIAVYAQEQVSPTKSFCEVTNTAFNVAYNFTKLTKPKEDIIINYKYPNETLKIQLCSPLKEKCNGKDGYGICLIRNKEERGIGKMPPEVINKPGKVVFLFTGDNCASSAKYKVTVIMKCDYSATGYALPELFPHTEEQCDLHMIWRTALACRPATETNCTIVDNGLHYDLSPLTRHTENYIVPTGNAKAPKIILNVCHSVIFEYGALCPMHSGACLYNASETSAIGYTNLGDVQKPPFMENGQLRILYEDGAICKARKTTVPHIKTTISFICDFQAIDTFPEYITGSEECHYQLIWKTAAACSVESLRNQSTITARTCTVTNPLRNFTYNLQSLINKDFYATTQNGTKYKFGICSSPMSAPCKSGTGVCLTNNSTSMGRANTNLLWQEGGPYLNYTDGDLCENGQHHYTIIAFICGPEGSPNTPLVMEEHPCQLIIHWNTDLVCDQRIACATDDGEINLSSLIKSNDNYVIKGNRTEFHINVCRPLVPTPGFTCAHGSAVCKASLSSSNEFVNESSLGFPLENPILNEERQAVLRYAGGSPCPEDPNRMISTNITFPCHYNDKGVPELQKYDKCTYVFEWKTSVTCGAVIGNWTSPCVIKDHLGHEYNLSLLQKDKKIYNVKNRQGKEYSINVCADKKFCNGSAICDGANGYGSLANVIFDYSRDIMKLQYSNGSKCMNSSYTSELRFICNESVGIGIPQLLWESQCSTEFEWRTNVTCAFQSSSQEPVHPPDKHEPAKELSPSHVGIVAGVVLTVVALLGAAFYFWDPNRRACLRSCLNSFGSKRNTGRVQYCRVNTTEEAWLLLDADPTQCQTDSDDDLLNA